jgi:hypothetical protein
MSQALLRSIAALVADANIAPGFVEKFYRWTDADVNGSANFILYRMAGTAGQRDQFVQRPDVRVLVVVPPSAIALGNQIADAIFQLFAGTAVPVNVLKLEPLGTVMGPMYLDNGRGVFEVIVRCFVQDH